MVIWWPGIRNWKRALKVDFARSWRRINFDLHVSVGFWTILIASFWAVSGIYFGWPRQIFQFVNSHFPSDYRAGPPPSVLRRDSVRPNSTSGRWCKRAARPRSWYHARRHRVSL